MIADDHLTYKFKVDDEVMFTDIDRVYSRFSKLAERLGLQYWFKSHRPNTGNIGTVTHALKHPTHGCSIYVVRVQFGPQYQDFIMGEEGLKLMEKTHLPDDLFEV